VLSCPPISPQLAETLETFLGGAVATCGLAGVFCSVMIYQVTLRKFWSFSRTGFKFLMTTLVLGMATTLVASVSVGLLNSHNPAIAPLFSVAELLAKGVAICVAVELAYELSILFHLRDKQHNELKRSALLLAGELLPRLQLRVLAGAIGGIVVPTIAMGLWSSAPSPALALSLLVALALLVVGELAERSLFFAAASAPRMPGGLG
jgi:DMSO reductase anchor subunit